MDLSEASSSDSQLCYNAYDLAALVLYNTVTVLLGQDYVDISNTPDVLPVFHIFQETIYEMVSEVRFHKIVSSNRRRFGTFKAREGNHKSQPIYQRESHGYRNCSPRRTGAPTYSSGSRGRN